MYKFKKAVTPRTNRVALMKFAVGSAALVTSAMAMAAPEIFVSAAGSDTLDGTTPTKSGSHGPVLTLTRARALAYQKRASNPGLSVVITMAPGAYYVSAGQRLQPADANTTFRSSAAGVRIIGGMPVNTWRTVTQSAILSRLSSAARANVRVADLKLSGVSQFGSLLPRGWFLMKDNPSPLELYSLGNPLKVAQYPNTGWIPITGGTAGGTVSFSSAHARRYGSYTGLMAFGYFDYDWADFTMPVASYSGGSSLSIQAPPYGVAAGGRFKIMNALEELDSPGEYYVDRSKGLVYYWPSSPLNRDAVVASVVEEPLFKVESADNITVKGITFESGRGRAIEISNSANAMVDGVTVKGVGREGVMLANCMNSTVQNSVFTDTGSSSIVVTGGNRITLTPSNNLIVNNAIARASRIERSNRAAIVIVGVGTTVRSNSIKNVPHMAIQIFGNDHLLEYNLIDGACQETGDAGAIYVGRDVTFQGNVVRYNLIKNVVATVVRPGVFTGVKGVYLDDCSSGFTVTGNIFDNVDVAITVGGGRDNHLSQNVFFRTNYDLTIDARGMNWGADMYKPGSTVDQELAALGSGLALYRTRYPQFAASIDDPNRALPKGNTLDTNILFKAGSIQYADPSYTQVLLVPTNNLTGSATMLTNPSGGDYSLKQGVSAGFIPPDATKIGAAPALTASL